MTETVSLNTKAQRRLMILTAVLGGRMTVAEASTTMGLSPRHTRRLVRSLDSEGASVLVHGNRGRPPANRLSDALRSEVLELVRDEYVGFNDVHLQEALLRDHGIRIGRETLRGLLRASGHAPKRKRRPPKHRRRRPRRPCPGMMVQWDGSHHHWLGPDRPRFVLMAAVDDAGGDVVGAVFVPGESGASYLKLLDKVLERKGIPESIYQDRHGAVCRNDGHWSLEEQLAGAQEPTQVGKILDELGIHPIFARSPQGKGRIERFFGVAQDRLVAEMRRSGIETLEEANQFLDDYWIDAYTARFAVPPADSESAYCPITEAQRRHTLSFRYERTVAADNTVRLGDIEIQIPPGPRGRGYAKARVEVRQHLDGTWTVFYQGQVVAEHPATPLSTPTRVRLQRRGKRRVRGADVALHVYFTPPSHELPEEVALAS